MLFLGCSYDTFNVYGTEEAYYDPPLAPFTTPPNFGLPSREVRHSCIQFSPAQKGFGA